jgi:rhodanese-related sulfurtransferase
MHGAEVYCNQSAHWDCYTRRPFLAKQNVDIFMEHLLPFIQKHPLLVSGIALLAIAAIVIELRHRLSAAAAVGPSDAVRLMNKGALVIDVRAAEAYATGHIIDARHIPQAELAAQADALKKYREKPVIVCCDSGVTSGASAGVLKSLGFTQVVNLRGGIGAWKTENMPLVTTTSKIAGKSKGSK